ncbi:MAG TPA: hypothetical protein VI094_14835 [Propionibacteriaceae bacterium]
MSITDHVEAVVGARFCPLVVLVDKDSADEADEPPPADRTVGSTNLAAREGA